MTKINIKIVPSFNFNLSFLVMSITINTSLTLQPFAAGTGHVSSKRHSEGTVPVLREQVTKQNVLYRLRSAKVIHLATHGSGSSGFLALSYVFLSCIKIQFSRTRAHADFSKEIETLNIPALVLRCDFL